MDALISRDESMMVVIVAQLTPTFVIRPTTCPFSVTAHMPSSRPEFVPLPMVNALL